MKQFIYIAAIIAFAAASISSQTPCRFGYSSQENCNRSVTGIANQTAGGNEAMEDKTEEKLRALHENWAKAVMSGDAAALEKLLADDFIETDADGEFWHKTQKIKFHEKFKGEIKVDASESVLRVYGKTAIVTGRFAAKPDTNEERICRYTVVYLKRDGRWQIVAAQLTHIKPEPLAKK
jgi:uncharacterized protein (TIGR02246 family)